METKHAYWNEDGSCYEVAGWQWRSEDGDSWTANGQPIHEDTPAGKEFASSTIALHGGARDGEHVA